MIHLGKRTRSTIVSKGISAGHGRQTYRGGVTIARSAEGARNHTQCDSLLIGGCGDLEAPRANGVALYDSVTRRLLSLPDETLVYPGHCLGGRRVSCIGEERERNPYFHGISRDRFVAVRTSEYARQSLEQQV